VNNTRRPRVGHIAFLNCLPIYWGLARSGALLDVVEYLRHADRLLLVPDIAVAADGPVLSVNLVSKAPLRELPESPKVSLTSTSRTGVLLARMLLERRHGLKPDFATTPPDLSSALAGADAAVLIGDEALRVHHDPGEHHVVDLAAAWKDWTGLPMVFAVWAVRREYAEAHPGLVKDVHGAFCESVRRCREEIDEVVASAARWEPFAPSALAEYFERLQFTLSDRHLEGLREFASRAAGYTDVAPLPEGGPEFFPAGEGTA
jgi:chorismate dehydratase